VRDASVTVEMTLRMHRPSPDRGAVWITAIDPTEDELRRLEVDAGFDREALRHALDRNERPRVRIMGETTFVLLRLPRVEAQMDIVFSTVPLGFLLGPTCGLTICVRDESVVRELAAYAEAEANHDPRHRVVLRGLELTAESFLRQLDRIGVAVDAVERRLQRSLENREVLELLTYQRSLVHFTGVLDAMHLLLERMQKMPELEVGAKNEGWLEDIRVEFHQALDTSVMSRDVLSEMMDAFASIISNNLNVVMKFLVAVTVVLTFPVMLASFYGMNVKLPGQGSPYAFAGTIAVSAAMSVAVAWYFRRRQWL
jgi:magnesium transporter